MTSWRLSNKAAERQRLCSFVLRWDLSHSHKYCYNNRVKKLLIAFIFILLSLFSSPKSEAFFDPLSIANNKVGIHILFPSELPQAAKLVNGNGGDWGYVTIPIQAGDRDLVKWQVFMDQARALHITPILRLATEGDYFNTADWHKPDESDILDFANFLNSLNWPVQNRYIIIFNETNRADEWGGEVRPDEYARLLSYAVLTFKAKSPDFFIIGAGMDNAAANTDIAMNEYDYLRQMNGAVPGVFNMVDGMASHSYANPAFSQPPYIHTSESITSFEYEHALVESLATKQLPVFITETGWSTNSVSDSTIAGYFRDAFATVWSEKDIVAVTPFLLQANGVQFGDFSLLNANGNPSLSYTALFTLPKIKGTPIINASLLSVALPTPSLAPVENFTNAGDNSAALSTRPFKQFVKWLLRINQ